MSTSAIDGRDWAVIVGISGVSHDYKKKEEDAKMTTGMSRVELIPGGVYKKCTKNGGFHLHFE